ncbi:hypothetical protein [Anaeromyxobacter diazotrophicus]|uniref:Uncharacterized protein n=1 Tax=Anaeromyxobacter diazotrophicus TaxID=2590199 RepID=A0A7I9VFZ7_9BACT|nr:hypothetical protein [Anaeromyxobacter diazotrophicus]GEJ55316.1 hypothetical protein AMYX_00570 [Anaeromyxobacter diazotrophicus]
MISLRVTAAALLAASAPAAALAQESVLDQPVEKEGWPTELTRRPLTLAEGMFEITLPLGVGLGQERTGRPVFLAPAFYYGVSDALTVGVRHFQGLCLSGGPECPKVYGDVSLDSLWSAWRGASTDLAVGVALAASPVTDPLALSVEGRLVARLRGGPASLTVAPSLEVGVTHRDDALVRNEPLAFPLATTSFGFYQTVARNRELLRVPVTLAVQASPRLAVAAAASLDGPLDGFSDAYRIPVGAAAVLSPSRMWDVGVSFTFLDLLGPRRAGIDRADRRGAQAFVSYRM